jgi:hypothetical protein
MEDYITRTEHTEYAKRVDEENARQNDRLDSLEVALKQILNISTSVEKLAIHMEHMSKEQEQQGNRLKVLEDRDGEKWRSVVSHIIVAVVTAVVAFILGKLGL